MPLVHVTLGKNPPAFQIDRRLNWLSVPKIVQRNPETIRNLMIWSKPNSRFQAKHERQNADSMSASVHGGKSTQQVMIGKGYADLLSGLSECSLTEIVIVDCFSSAGEGDLSRPDVTFPPSSRYQQQGFVC